MGNWWAKEDEQEYTFKEVKINTKPEVGKSPNQQLNRKITEIIKKEKGEMSTFTPQYVMKIDLKQEKDLKFIETMSKNKLSDFQSLRIVNFSDSLDETILTNIK